MASHAKHGARRKSDQWIQSAIQNPGALRAQAKREGAITQRGTISQEWLEEKAKQGGTVGRRARLAQTLRKLSQRRAAERKSSPSKPAAAGRRTTSSKSARGARTRARR